MQTPEIIYKDSKTFPGTKKAIYWWKNKTVPGSIHRGYVWLVHGVGEHLGRYNEFANYLTQFGYDVVGVDLPGHGLSKKIGKQRHLVHTQAMLDEVMNAFIAWNIEMPLADRVKNAPWFLIGHSMGTILSLKWMLNGNKDLLKQFNFAEKVILSSPPLKLRLKVPAWKDWLAHQLVKVTPHLALSNEITVDQLTSDEVIKQQTIKDPLFHGSASPELYLSMNSFVEEILQNPQNIEVPLCIGVGTDDPVCDPQGTEDYYNQLKTHKKLLKFDGFKHEILNEIGRENVYEEFLKWLMKN